GVVEGGAAVFREGVLEGPAASRPRIEGGGSDGADRQRPDVRVGGQAVVDGGPTVSPVGALEGPAAERPRIEGRGNGGVNRQRQYRSAFRADTCPGGALRQSHPPSAQTGKQHEG